MEPALDKPRVGISTCLLGQPVRYDGGHKRDRFLTDTFGKYVEWVPVCPEVECGLPTPRPSMRLEGDVSNPRLIVTKTGDDQTERMQSWSKKRITELKKEHLIGFIFKSKSPSSGMQRVRVYNQHGMPHAKGVGLFAKAFMDAFHLLPTEEEGRLHDIRIRENFIERIFCLQRYRQALKPRASVGKLVAFHTEHKYQLMSHSQQHLRQMGQLVATAKKSDFQSLLVHYEELLLSALLLHASISKNINVLQHMLGYFKQQLSADEKQELLETFQSYREGYIPLIVCITLLQHFIRKYDQPYLKTQTYLNPHPIELKLRNHS